jgi:hypothetical protein
MEKNFIYIGYELWNLGYPLASASFEAEKYAHDLFVELCEEGTIENVKDFLDWILYNRPEMVYNEAEEAERYRRENEPKLRAYFAEHFEGKTWDEIDPDCWDWYSDWHKDVFGYRPHGIVCGEYINPHGGAF